MKKELMKMLSNPKGEDKEMSKEDIMAKMDVLKELLEMANMKSGDDFKKGMEKVSVTAPDKEGLMMGLDKAKDIIGKNEMSDEMPEMMKSEDEEDEEDEDEE